jgi:hypothetical protein
MTADDMFPKMQMRFRIFHVSHVNRAQLLFILHSKTEIKKGEMEDKT